MKYGKVMAFISVIIIFINLLPEGLVFPKNKVSASSYREITVYSEETEANPGVYWWQRDDGKFVANKTSGGDEIAPMGGTEDKPYPQDWYVYDRLDMRNYRMPSVYIDPITDKKYFASEVYDIEIDGTPKWHPRFEGITFGASGLKKEGKHHVIINTKTGISYQEQDYERFGTRPNGKPKVRMLYRTPLLIKWKGKVRVYDTGLDLKPSKGNACVGDSIDIEATLTKSDGSKYKIGSHSNMTWSVSPSDSASFYTTSTGIKITGKKAGKVTVNAHFYDSSQGINERASVTVNFDDCGAPGLRLNVPVYEACYPYKIDVQAILTKKDGSVYKLGGHSSLTWTASGATIEYDVDRVWIKPNAPDSRITVTAHFYDPSQGINERKSVTLNFIDCDDPTIPPPKPEEPEREPVPDPSGEGREPGSTSGQASGNAFWELRRTNESKPSDLYAEVAFSKTGRHFATRNERQTMKLGSHPQIQRLGKITSTVNAASVKNHNMQYEYSYEFTNYYYDRYQCVDGDEKGCYEWRFVERTPVWSKGETYRLSGTLKMDHRQNDVIERNSIEQILQEKLLVGRSDRWTNNNRSSQEYYEGFNKLTNHFKSKVNLKTQSTMIIKPDTLEYEVFLPSEIHKQSNFKPFKKGLIHGHYFPVDVDPSLQEELANHSEHDLGDYALFLQQSTMKDKGLKSNKRNFELEFVSDHMFITADTGFMVSYPFAYELNRHFLYGEHKPTEQLVTDLTKRKMSQEYYKQTGQEYMDEIMYLDKDVSLDEWEKYQRYFIPVTPKSPLQTNTTYVNNILLNNAGLSDVTWQYGQEFLFEHWMFGSGHDEAWLIEQPDPRIPVDLKDTKRILIKHEDKFTILDLLRERPQKRIHEFRRMDQDWVDKMKGVVGDWSDQ